MTPSEIMALARFWAFKFAGRWNLGYMREDLVQEAALAIWRAAKVFDPSKASFRTWAYYYARAYLRRAAFASGPVDAPETGSIAVAELDLEALMLDVEDVRIDQHTVAQLSARPTQDDYLEAREAFDDPDSEEQYAAKMQLAGFTTEEIGEAFGYSRQHAHKVINRFVKACEQRKARELGDLLASEKRAA